MLYWNIKISFYDGSCIINVQKVSIFPFKFAQLETTNMLLVLPAVMHIKHAANC